ALIDDNTPAESRLLLLRVTTQMRPKASWLWLAALGRSLAHPEPAVCRAALAAVKATGWTQFGQQLLELSRQDKLLIELRVVALECLAERRAIVGVDSFALLLAQLSEKTDPLIRLAAARTLGASHLSGEQLQRLTKEVPGVSTMVLRQLL